MFLHGFGEDQDIVHVDRDNLCDDEVVEDHVHHCLECGRGVAESEEHDKAFIQAIFG